MNVVREIQKINDLELREGISGPASWHYQYKDSAWVYVGGLSQELTEGDLLCIMSQWGEIEDSNLVRDEGTGKSKGFAFIKYCDQRSTILAVDNFTGAQLLGRTLRVDHVKKYRLPKELREKPPQEEEEGGQTQQWRPGHAYEGKELSGEATFQKGINIWEPPSEDKEVDNESGDVRKGMSESRKKKKAKKDKYHHKAKTKDEKKRKMENIMAENSNLGTNQQSSIPEITKLQKKSPVPVPDAIVQSASAQAGGVADWRGLRTSGSTVGGGYSIGGGRQGKGYRNDEGKERKDKDPYRLPNVQGVPELYASNRTIHHHGMGGMTRHR